MVRLKDGERLSFASDSTPSVHDMKAGKAKLVKVASSSSPSKKSGSDKNPDFPPHYIQPMVQQALAKDLLVCGTLRCECNTTYFLVLVQVFINTFQ